jgi:predicted nucleotidyltransferase
VNNQLFSQLVTVEEEAACAVSNHQLLFVIARRSAPRDMDNYSVATVPTVDLLLDWHVHDQVLPKQTNDIAVNCVRSLWLLLHVQVDCPI